MTQQRKNRNAICVSISP